MVQLWSRTQHDDGWMPWEMIACPCSHMWPGALLNHDIIVHRNKRPDFPHRAQNVSQWFSKWYIRTFLFIPLLVSSDAKSAGFTKGYEQMVITRTQLWWPHTPVTSTLTSTFGPSLHFRPMLSVIIFWCIILVQTLFEDVRSGTEGLWRCSLGPPIVCSCHQRSVA